jgi:hypothetical protein
MIIYIILGIIIILLLRRSDEHFVDTGMRHVKLNDWGGIEYVDRRPPYWRGDRSCFRYPCPAVFADDTVCWKCDWLYSSPQNE